MKASDAKNALMGNKGDRYVAQRPLKHGAQWTIWDRKLNREVRDDEDIDPFATVSQRIFNSHGS